MGLTPKHCAWYFVIINSVLLNLFVGERGGERGKQVGSMSEESQVAIT